jgi:uncharacterized protein YdiU (UPF0061 family)
MPFDNSYIQLPDRFYEKSEPVPVKAPRLLAFNSKLASELGLELDGLDEVELAKIFAGNQLLEGSEPLSMAYAAHQFGNFVPKLGDGRAILLGEVVDQAGKRRDIQLKGAGRTAFSRRGDGRSALGPVLREYIMSEAMFALGVPATRALAAVASGERVQRETGQPGGVFTRVAASHIRIGTFQYFASREDHEALKLLSDHVIERHYPEIKGGENQYLALLEGVAERQMQLIAKWLSIGFIHGVMNTDNMAVSGETIDFGPCAFLDEYHPLKVFSSIDANGRYAYNNQPGIAQWNIARFAECLLPLLDNDIDKAAEMANGVLAGFSERFPKLWLEAFAAKLGLNQPRDGDMVLIQKLLGQMQASSTDFTVTFRALCDAAEGNVEPFRSLFIDLNAIDEWLAEWQSRAALEVLSDEQRATQMRLTNPAHIPRNHRIEEVIAAAVDDEDFESFDQMLRAIEHPFEELPEFVIYRQPPFENERVLRTFCGT